MDQHISENNLKFEIGQTIMFKNQTCHTFESKYLLDYRVLKILNDSTLLLVTLNGKERKPNVNDVKPSSTSELIEKAWASFLGSIKSNHQNSTYNLNLDFNLNLNFEQTIYKPCFKYILSGCMR